MLDDTKLIRYFIHSIVVLVLCCHAVIVALLRARVAFGNRGTLNRAFREYSWIGDFMELDLSD